MNALELENLKKQKLEDLVWYFDLSKSQKQALMVTHGCETLYDLVSLFGRRVCGIKGFSEKNFVKLKRDVLRRIQGKVCCYKNQYVEIYHDTYSQFTGEHEISIYVKNKYPVDDALSVSFDKADIWGHKLKENGEWFHSTSTGKALVMVLIDRLSKSEIVFRLSTGEQLLDTDFYAVECKPEIIFDRLEIKAEPEKIIEIQKPKPSVIKETGDDKRIKSIVHLFEIGILSERECNDIVSYLKGEADIFNVGEFSDDDFEVDFDDELL